MESQHVTLQSRLRHKTVRTFPPAHIFLSWQPVAVEITDSVEPRPIGLDGRDEFRTQGALGRRKSKAAPDF